MDSETLKHNLATPKISADYFDEELDRLERKITTNAILSFIIGGITGIAMMAILLI